MDVEKINEYNLSTLTGPFNLCFSFFCKGDKYRYMRSGAVGKSFTFINRITMVGSRQELVIREAKKNAIIIL